MLCVLIRIEARIEAILMNTINISLLYRRSKRHPKLYQFAFCPGVIPASILRKSTSGRHRPVSYPDGPMTVRYRFT